MYNYFYGEIVEINPINIVMDVAGVGYEFNVANPYSFEINSKVKIYAYQYVREDELLLFGFKTKEEKNLFLDLISVKGIGPKTALLIIAATNVQEFQKAIIDKNIDYLVKFPKIGKKSAQQIILDLENKYSGLFDSENLSIGMHDNGQEKELKEALKSLGYDEKIILKILPKVDKNLKLELKIKEALKLLIKI